jgi:hypothetical protein
MGQKKHGEYDAKLHLFEKMKFDKQNLLFERAVLYFECFGWGFRF